MKALNILVVDDESDYCTLMRLGFPEGEDRFSVESVEECRECLDCIKGGKVDCILADYRSPGTNGARLLGSLKDMAGSVPVIILSGEGGGDTATGVVRSAAREYFSGKEGLGRFAGVVVSVDKAVKQRLTDESHSRAKMELDERVRHAALGSDVGSALTRGGTLQEMLQGCAEAIVRHLDAAFARVWTLDAQGETLELQASAGMYTHLDGPHGRVPVGMYKIGLIAKERKPHLTNQVVGDPRIGDQDWARREGMVSFAGHPLIVGDNLVGVMAMFSRKPLTEVATDALAYIADNVAVGIERKRTESALRESEEKFRSLVEESLAGAYVIQEDRFTYVNPRLAEMLGYTVGELLEMEDIMAVIHPEDRSLAREKMQRRLTGEIKSAHYTFRVIRKTGEIIYFDALGWGTEYNKRPAIIGTVLDVTVRRQAEEEKSSLFNMMTHDIKGPLTVIYGYGEVLSGMVGEGEPLEMVEEIKKATNRISALITDMLELSKIESGKTVLKPETFGLGELLRQLVKDAGVAAAEMDLKVSLEVEEGLPQINGDKVQIGRALENLLSNAVNYNRHGGSITVRAGTDAVNDGGVFVEVSDTGIGVPAEDVPHLFEKYYRSKKSWKRRGTGLGLSLVKAVAEAHGGSVEAVSEEGKGSSFRLNLPAA